MKQIIILILVFFISTSTYSQIKKDFYVVEQNGKKGYVDNNLNIAINPIYDELGGFKENFFGDYSIFQLNSKYGLLDVNGKHAIPAIYESLSNTSSPKILQFGKDGKYGLLDVNGKKRLASIYEYGIYLIGDGKMFIAKKNNKYGILNKKGVELTEFKYDYLEGKFNSNICVFKNGEKYGYVNKNGKEIIPSQFDFARTFNNDYAIVSLNGKYAIINKKGEIIIKPIYDEINYQYSFYHDFDIEVKEKVYYIRGNKKIGLLNENLKIIIEPIYDEIGDFNEGFAYVKKDNKYGFINKKGAIIVPLEYEDADSFSEGLAPVVRNGKWGYVDTENNIKIDFKFIGCVKPFFNGLAVYRKRNFKSSKAHYVNDRCGYIDLNGDIKISPIYRNSSRFINGVAKNEDQSSVYLVDKENNRVILKQSDDQIMEVESN